MLRGVGGGAGGHFPLHPGAPDACVLNFHFLIFIILFLAIPQVGLEAI